MLTECLANRHADVGASRLGNRRGMGARRHRIGPSSGSGLCRSNGSRILRPWQLVDSIRQPSKEVEEQL